MYKLNEEEMFCDIADNFAIIINSKTGIYYGINTLGTAIFEYLLKGASTGAILTALRQIPGTPADAEEKLQAFVKKLTDYQIIISGPSSEQSVTLDARLAAQDAFTPDVSEYSDAQELLLADPIHDVKKETGWQPVIKEA
ncbi:MAG: PqqD family peptide modification chaperone [Verrucomicrobiales bacterium]|jgi:hypothetical protein|nr:PqqD family peptide modification chaperone [Verrucomicrobiales bacterium]